MKKSLIPILSLLFIISLDSCKKDSDNQPPEQQVGDTTRVIKATYTYEGSSTIETIFFEYDKSGRIISLKDSADPGNYVTISYVGDEAIFEDAPATPGNFNYSARYKLNSNRLPVHRITAEKMDGMSTSTPRFQIYTDTCKFEYDAAGLLVKAAGTGYDSSWANYTQSGVYFSSTRKAYTINYTNKDGKLMSFKINGTEAFTSTRVGGSTNKSAESTEENYSFEYTKNYANKVDSINAWVFCEVGTLYGKKFPTIKYGYLHDTMNYSIKRKDLSTGIEYPYTDAPKTRTLEYLPSGYVSSITYSTSKGWNRTTFTYNK
jgi:hypothetical protein